MTHFQAAPSMGICRGLEAQSLPHPHPHPRQVFPYTWMDGWMTERMDEWMAE